MKEILNTIIADSNLHARWLNTLSLLEFMGTRKIARSAILPELDEMRLRHLAEEARHAHFFKRMAVRVGLASDAGYEPVYLLSSGGAIRYFHGLDAAVKKTLQATRQKHLLNPTLCYLYVTTLIEERAGVVYKLYEQLLSQTDLPIRLGGLLGEEERHLADMSAALGVIDLDCESRLKEMRILEKDLFVRFQKRLSMGLRIAVVA